MARGLRKHFQQGGNTDPAAMSGTVIFSNGQQANPSWIGPSSGSGMNAGNYSLATPYSQAPTVQNAPSGGGGDSGGGGGGSEGGDITSGVFKDVSMVYQNLNQNTLTNQQVANDIFNRNVQRKQLALNEATAASNLRGSAQNQIEQGITFGQSQQDRAGQQKIAAAWAAGVGKGLGGAKT
jgi:hypothetical protein